MKKIVLLSLTLLTLTTATKGISAKKLFATGAVVYTLANIVDIEDKFLSTTSNAFLLYTTAVTSIKMGEAAISNFPNPRGGYKNLKINDPCIFLSGLFSIASAISGTIAYHYAKECLSSIIK